MGNTVYCETIRILLLRKQHVREVQGQPKGPAVNDHAGKS